MPRRRHEERSSSYSSSPIPSRRSSSSSSSSSSPSPRSERRSSSRSRTTAASSPSPQTSGRSSSRPSPRPAPATSSVAASAPPRSQSPRTESSTPHTASSNSYKASSDGDYSMFEGMVRGLLRARSDDRASSGLSSKATSTNDGENLFGSMIRALICPRPVVVSGDASTAPVVVPVSPCDTQTKAFQDCLQDFETDISKCQFHMNVLSQCKRFSDSKLNSDSKFEA
ncbi:hypothetical protein V5N11_005421 [Cardamine amara subsp. amara]|uniref:CHCH domain-containing protein n=1 Tax=Cardamine amara subsp. amara TaxID=228776 RepID=A0ABD0ZY03_CARAN